MRAVGSISPVAAIPRLADLVALLGTLKGFLDSDVPRKLAEIAEKTEAANSIIAQANDIAERETEIREREERVEANETALKKNVKHLNAILSAA